MLMMLVKYLSGVSWRFNYFSTRMDFDLSIKIKAKLGLLLFINRLLCNHHKLSFRINDSTSNIDETHHLLSRLALILV